MFSVPKRFNYNCDISPAEHEELQREKLQSPLPPPQQSFFERTKIMAKFSDLVVAAGTTDAALKVDQTQLATDQAAVGSAHGAVVAALHSKTPPRADLAQADGSVNEVTLNADGTDFVVTNIGGDFTV